MKMPDSNSVKWMSRCLGCKGWVKHELPEEDESVREIAYCDRCLVEMKESPRGTFLAWKQSSLPIEE